MTNIWKRIAPSKLKPGMEFIRQDRIGTDIERHRSGWRTIVGVEPLKEKGMPTRYIVKYTSWERQPEVISTDVFWSYERMYVVKDGPA